MFAEWLLVVLLLAGAAFLFLVKSSGRGLRVFVPLLMVAGFLAVGGRQKHLKTELDSREQLSVPHLGRPDEYAGSASCRTCHPNQYNSWHQSFHRTMTQIASKDSVRGSFDNVTLDLDGEAYRLEKRGAELWVDMVDPDWKLQRDSASKPALLAKEASPPRVQRRVSMVTGSHHMQAFWVDNKHGNQQFSFPFTYLFEQERWVPRRSVFLMDPRATNWAQIWNVGCIGCHSTAGQPRPVESSDAFDSRVAELGIACEACHGPAGNHVRRNSDPLQRYRLHFQKKGDERIVHPGRLSSKRSSEICGRCHSIHSPHSQEEWLRNGDNFHPGEDLKARLQVLDNPKSAELRQSSFWNDGMIRVSGREYNGLIKTPCFQRGEMSCLSCHSMHQSSPTNQLAIAMESNTACLQCHKSFEGKIEQHTRHSAGSSGSLCYNCHMPYTTYGLLKALRSHQISSPSVKATLQTGRPNACNLCHLDKTLDWTSKNLSAWYGTAAENLSAKDTTVAASIRWALQGDAGQRALIAWHMGWPPARDISKESWLAPYLATLMQDAYPAVRYIAGRSLKRLSGFENLSYDYIAPSGQLERSAESVFEAWMKKERLGANPTLLLNKDGHLDEAAARELLNSRNNRVVELSE
jgi:predicted CXXCH cytochrome family protein